MFNLVLYAHLRVLYYAEVLIHQNLFRSVAVIYDRGKGAGQHIASSVYLYNINNM